MKTIFKSVLCVALSAQSAWAGIPSVYRVPPDIKNLHGYPILAAIDDENPSTVQRNLVYYYPRENSYLKMEGTNYNQTVLNEKGRRGGLCTSFDTTQRTHNSVAAAREKVFGETQTPENAKKRSELENALEDAAKDRGDRCGPVIALEKQLQEEEAALQKIDGDILLAPGVVKDCIAAGGNPDDCRKLLTDLTEQRKAALIDLQKTRVALSRLRPACSTAKNREEVARQILEEFEDRVYGRLIKIEKVLTDLQASFDWYGEIHGGNLTGIWNDGYQEAKRDLEKDNPGLRVQPLPQTQINYYVGGAETIGKLSAFLGWTASGVTEEPKVKQGEVDLTAEKSVTPVDQASGANAKDSTNDSYYSLLQATPFKVVPSSQSGTNGAVSVSLSVPGACAVLAMGENGTGTPGITVTSTSVFPNGSSVRVKAKYNMWKIYEKMERAGVRSHGFLGLSREAYSNFWERQREGDDFSFEFYAEDPVDSARQDEIRRELKEELKTRIASNAVMSHGGGLPGLPNPGTIGIMPLWRSFGFLNFKVLTIFSGDSSSTSQVKSTWDKTVTEEWNYSRITPMVVTRSMLMTL